MEIPAKKCRPLGPGCLEMRGTESGNKHHSMVRKYYLQQVGLVSSGQRRKLDLLVWISGCTFLNFRRISDSAVRDCCQGKRMMRHHHAWWAAPRRAGGPPPGNLVIQDLLCSTSFYKLVTRLLDVSTLRTVTFDVTLHENGVQCGRWLRIWTRAGRDLFGAEKCLDLFPNIILFTNQQTTDDGRPLFNASFSACFENGLYLFSSMLAGLHWSPRSAGMCQNQTLCRSFPS